MNVGLFFTYDISLSEWDRLKIIDRELKFYNEIVKGSPDINYTFITYGDDEDLKYNNKYPNIEIFPIYLKIKKPENKFIRLINSFLIPFKIKKTTAHLDIYKTNQLFGSWVPIILKFLNKKPLIIRTGFDLLKFSVKENKNILKIFSFYLLTQISLLSSDKYFVSSIEDKEFISKYFLLMNKSKLQLRPNWISSAEKIDLENRENKKILSVGRLEKQKNYFNLISSLKNSEYSLDIVGEGSLKEELIAHAKKNNVKVNFLGLVHHKKLLNLYREYKFFVMASNYEGHPKSLIEAMSRGCIPVVNKIKNVENIIFHKKNGILYNANSENLINFIKDINLDKKLSLNLANEAIKFVNDNYSISKEVQKEIAAYEDLIKN